jgi:hypothetical protein
MDRRRSRRAIESDRQRGALPHGCAREARNRAQGGSASDRSRTTRVHVLTQPRRGGGVFTCLRPGADRLPGGAPGSKLCSTGCRISQARRVTSRGRFRALGGPALIARRWCIGYAQRPRRNYHRREVGKNFSHCGTRMSAIACRRGGSLRLRRRHFVGGGSGRRGGDGAVRSFRTSEVLL